MSTINTSLKCHIYQKDLDQQMLNANKKKVVQFIFFQKLFSSPGNHKAAEEKK